jgi:hypothetical protein
MIKNVFWSSCPIFMKLEFIRQIFEKNHQISIFMKIHPVGVVFYVGGRTYGRTDVTKLIVAFRNFANAHKNCYKGPNLQEKAVVRTLIIAVGTSEGSTKIRVLKIRQSGD